MENLIQLVADCFARHNIEPETRAIQLSERIATPVLSTVDISPHHDSRVSPAEEPVS